MNSQAEACVTVVSGDFAFSGKAQQYEEALDFMSQLEDELAAIADWELHWVVVPGNHDCDFELDTQARQLLLNHVRGTAVERIDSSTAELFTLVQQPFFSFLDGVQNRLTTGHSPALSWDIRLDVSGSTVAFHCLNTAWMSELHERQGALLFPIGNIPDDRDRADLAVAVMHHPFNWLDFRNARALNERVTAIADLILTGHEHRADKRGQVLHCSTSFYRNWAPPDTALQDPQPRTCSGSPRCSSHRWRACFGSPSRSGV